MKKQITRVAMLALLGTSVFGSSYAQTDDEETNTDKERVALVDPNKEIVPFEGQDQTWQNGADRRSESVLQTKYFTGSFMFDGNYNYSFNNPIDNTVVGSTALARHNEMNISFVGLGGDFNYKNARARVMLQLGNRSIVIPRNDYSPYRGQYKLHDALRYMSEANVGYHFTIGKG